MKNLKPQNRSSYSTNQFTWIPFYQELAKELVKWVNKQSDLISFLETLRADGHVITPLMDKDKNGSRFLLKEIDPFTFFGVFNRHIGYEQRINILIRIKQFFKLKSDIPEDFNGVPILINLKSWFISYQSTRNKNDVSKLWKVLTLSGMEIEVISILGRVKMNSEMPSTVDGERSAVSGVQSIFASMDNNMLTNVERPSLETIVPATVAELRMLSGASSLSAVFNVSGQCSDSSKVCNLLVAPITSSFPFFVIVSSSMSCKSTTETESDVLLERSVPPPSGTVFG